MYSHSPSSSFNSSFAVCLSVDCFLGLVDLLVFVSTLSQSKTTKETSECILRWSHDTQKHKKIRIISSAFKQVSKGRGEFASIHWCGDVLCDQSNWSISYSVCKSVAYLDCSITHSEVSSSSSSSPFTTTTSSSSPSCSSCSSSSSPSLSSAFPSYISGVHHFGWDFCVSDRFWIHPLR